MQSHFSHPSHKTALEFGSKPILQPATGILRLGWTTQFLFAFTFRSYANLWHGFLNLGMGWFWTCGKCKYSNCLSPAVQGWISSQYQYGPLCLLLLSSTQVSPKVEDKWLSELNLWIFGKQILGNYRLAILYNKNSKKQTRCKSPKRIENGWINLKNLNI